MRARRRAWTLSAAMALAAVAACGGPVGPIIGSDDIAVFPDSGFDATVQRDASPDARDSAYDGPKFNGGGPFLCDQCMCDGTLHLCLHAGGGGINMPLDVDAGADASPDADADVDAAAPACEADAAFGTCTQIPIGCLPSPTCECLLAHYGGPPACDCRVDPTGNGLWVSCFFP